MRALFLVAILVLGCGGTAATAVPQPNALTPPAATPAAATLGPTVSAATSATPTPGLATASPTPAAATAAPPTPAPVPTLAPPTPTVAPTEEAQQPLRVVEFGFSQTKAGSVYYGIVVENPNTTWAAFGTGVGITFLDAGGKEVTRLGGLIGQLLPGQRTAIGSYSPSAQGAKTMQVELETQDWAPLGEQPVPLTVTDVETKTSGNVMTTTGTITNSSAQPFDFVSIQIVYRDAAGKIIGGWSDITSVPASGKADFEVRALEVLPAKATEVFLAY